MIDYTEAWPADHNIEAHNTWNVQDSTKVQCYLDCPRRYFYEYVMGWRPDKPSTHLVFGSAMHIALEHLINNGYDKVEEAFALFMHEYRATIEMEDDHGTKTPENLADALFKYAETYARDQEERETLFTEIAGPVLINTEGRSLIFKTDHVYRDKKTGKVWAQEHKSGSATGLQQKYWAQQWYLSFQISTYTHALYSMYPPEEVAGVEVNSIHFCKRKKDPVELLRVAVKKHPADMGAWLWEANTWVDRIEEDFARLADCREEDTLLRAFPKCPTSCSKFAGCTWLDFCKAWPNPLREAHYIPVGYKRDFWDPREEAEKATTKVDLTQGGAK